MTPLGFDDDRRAVGMLGHPAKEQRTLRHHHRTPKVSPPHPRKGMAEIGDARGNVPLGRSEPRHPALLDEGVDILSPDFAHHDGQRREGAVVGPRDIARASASPCGVEGCPAAWRPAISRFTRGPSPSPVPSKKATDPRTSSKTGISFSMWRWAFIPSLASEPPPTMATLRTTPAWMRAAPWIKATTGAAQTDLMSVPAAFTQPAISAMALARLPPPRL